MKNKIYVDKVLCNDIINKKSSRKVGMVNMKKEIIVIAVVSFLSVGLVNYFNSGNNSYPVVADKSNPTVEQIHGVFNKYLADKNLKLKPGSPEYIRYLSDILIFDNDKDIKKLPEYDDILIYASNYIVESDMIEAGSVRDIFKVYDDIPDKMENKTIKELIELYGED